MNYNEISFRELLSSSIFTLQIHSLTPPLCQEPNWVTRIPYPFASSREFRLHVLPVILPACLLTTQHLPSLSHAPSAVTPIHNPSSHNTCVLSHFSHVQLFVTPWTAQQSSAILSAPHWAVQVGSFSHCLSTLGQRFLISWALPWKARSRLLCFEHHIILGAPHVKDSVSPPPPPITTFLPAQPYMSGE